MTPITFLRQWTANDGRSPSRASSFENFGWHRETDNDRRIRHLPWYVMLGASASGKSTLLHQCGKNWQQTDVIKRIAGNQAHDCTGWATSDALVLEMAECTRSGGNNTPAAAEHWQYLLARLRKYRGQQPINGIMITVSIEELLTQSLPQLQQTARLLRRRIDELQQQFNTGIPCYLMVTKCDLLPGFNEFFGDLSHEARQQIWGAMLPPNSPAMALMPQFGSLAKTLHTLLPRRLANEQDIAWRQALSGFPLQFEMLGPRLAELIATLFASGSLPQLHTLRGACFSCADQQGAPVGNFLAGIAAGFGIRPSATTLRNDSHSSFFTQRIFNDIISVDSAPDQNGLHHAPYARRIHIDKKRPMAIAIASVATVCIGAWISTFFSQRADILEIQTLLGRYSSLQQKTHNNTGTQNFSTTQRAVSLLQRAAEIAVRHEKVEYLSPGMHDSRLAAATHGTYTAALQQQWLPALALFIQQQQVTDASYGQQLAALKAWLMLIDPKHRDIEYLQQWVGSTPIFGSDQLRASIQTQLMQLYKTNRDFVVNDPDKAFVKQMRQRLLAVAPHDRLYAQWLARFKDKHLELKPMLGAQADSVFRTHSSQTLTVPAIYTASAYKMLDFSPLAPELKEITRDGWVLDDDATTQQLKDVTVAQVRNRYLRDYADTWNAVFNGISLQPTHSPVAVLAILQSLADPSTSPLARLLKVTAENSLLQAATADLNRQISSTAGFDVDAPSVPQSDMQPAIVALPATTKSTEISSTLAELHDWLATIYRSGDSGNTALQALRADAGGVNPVQKTLLLASRLPEPVAGWIASLARSAAAAVSNSASKALNLAWRQQVGSYCKAGIEPHYPFASDAKAQITDADFVDYFRPGGIEDSFVRKHLNDYIDRSSWTSTPGAAVKLSAQTLRTLLQGQRIREAFFGSDKSHAGFQFRVTPSAMSAQLQQFSMQYGSQIVEYTHGPKLATRLNWPQHGEQLSVSFHALNNTTRLRDSTGSREFEGSWALYRLLDTAKISHRQGTGNFTATFGKGNNTVALNFSNPQRHSPLQRELLTNYRCIDHL